MTYDFQENRQIRIIISSTFRDKMKERDYLTARIFPELRRYCEERDISLFELDLQWGVTQEESETQMAFNISLDEANSMYNGKIYESVEQLGQQVEKDFKTFVDSHFPEKRHLSDLEMERMQQHVYLKSKTRSYVSHPEWMKFLDDFSDSGGKEAVVTGVNGSGKCALLANWIAERHENKNSNEKIIYHFTGVSRSEGDYLNITQRLINEINDFCKISERENIFGSGNNKKGKKEGFILYFYNLINIINKENNEDLREELQNLLFAIPEDQKLIIVIDSLDSLVDEDNAKMLNWIPAHPFNVKIIFSSTLGDKTMEALTRRTDKKLELGSLPAQARKELITRYFEKFSKKLSAAQMEKIISDKKSENPAVLTAILDNLRIFGNFDIFDKQIDECLSQENNESLFDLFLQNIESLFRENGKTRENIVKDILSLIAVSRRGLTETEIVNITNVPKLNWVQLFNCMSVHLISINGFIIFSSGIMRNAVMNRYLKSKSANQAYRQLISAYMETNGEISFSRKCYELPFKLMELSAYDKLYNFLLDKNVFVHIYTKNKYELGNYWRFLRKQNPKRYKMEKYLELKIEDKDEATGFLENISLFINNIIFDPFLALTFAKKHLEICIENFGKFNEKTAVSYIRIGSCYSSKSIGDYKKALEYFTIAKTIYERVNGKDHYTVATAYCNIATCYSNSSIGKYDEAIDYYTNALNIVKKELEDDGDSLVATIYGNIGQCYINDSNLPDAVEYCYKALKINEKYYGKEHPKTAQSYNVMGGLMYNLKQFAESVHFLTTFINIWVDFFGEEQFNIAEAYNNIGFCYMGLKENEKAIEASDKAISLFVKIYGENTDKAASAYFNVGMCCHSSEDYKKSIEYFKKYITIVEKNPVTDPFRIAFSKCKIANCYYEMCEYDEALKYYNETLAVYSKKFGEEHLQVGIMYDDMAVCHDELGDYDAALNYYNKAISIYELFDNTEDLIEGAQDSVDRINSGSSSGGPSSKPISSVSLFSGSSSTGGYTGEGSSEYDNGDKYEGYYVNGKRNGKGTYTYANGDVYEGDYINDMRYGNGKMAYCDGTVEEGKWDDDKFVGE